MNKSGPQTKDDMKSTLLLSPGKAAGDGDETEILRACCKGDRQAFGWLVERYKRRAYYSALGLVGCREAAVDLSQDAFIKAWRAIKTFDPGKRFYTWYYQILRNLCYNFLRDRKRHARPFSECSPTELSRLADAGADMQADVEQRELAKAVWDGLANLKPAEREILILKEFQNHAYKEIAAMLDIPVGTVMSRLYNARKALKEQLEDMYP